MDKTHTGDLSDDPNHPIPNVHAYDTVLTLGSGGAYLGIVIAAPLDATMRSLCRLREKQKFYLESFYSEFGREQWGTPKEGKMKIYINIHPSSSKEVFDVLGAFCNEARGRGVEVTITREIP